HICCWAAMRCRSYTTSCRRWPTKSTHGKRSRARLTAEGFARKRHPCSELPEYPVGHQLTRGLHVAVHRAVLTHEADVFAQDGEGLAHALAGAEDVGVGQSLHQLPGLVAEGGVVELVFARGAVD